MPFFSSAFRNIPPALSFVAACLSLLSPVFAEPTEKDEIELEVVVMAETAWAEFPDIKPSLSLTGLTKDLLNLQTPGGSKPETLNAHPIHEQFSPVEKTTVEVDKEFQISLTASATDLDEGFYPFRNIDNYYFYWHAGYALKPDCRAGNNLVLKLKSYRISKGAEETRMPDGVTPGALPYDVNLPLTANYWEEFEFAAGGYDQIYDPNCEDCTDSAVLEFSATAVLTRRVTLGSTQMNQGAGPSGSATSGQATYVVAASSHTSDPRLAFSLGSVGTPSATFIGVGETDIGSSQGHALYLTDETLTAVVTIDDVTTVKVYGRPPGDEENPLETAEAVFAAVHDHGTWNTITFTRTVSGGNDTLEIEETQNPGMIYLLRRESSSGLVAVTTATETGELREEETRYLATTHDSKSGSLITQVWTGSDAPGLVRWKRGVYAPDAPAPFAGRPWFEETPAGPRHEYTYELGDYDPLDQTFTPAPPSATGPYLRISEILGDGGGSTFLVANRSTRTATIAPAAAEERIVLETLEIHDGTEWQPARSTIRTYNPDGELLATTRGENTLYSATLDGGLKTSETDETGIITDYSEHDANGVPTTRTKRGVVATADHPAQLDIVSTTDEISGVRTETETGGGDTRVFASTWNGSIMTSRTERGLTTYYSGDSQTLPSGSTQERAYYGDGRIRRLSGTAVIEEHHAYETDPVTGHETHTTYYGNAYGPTDNYLAVTTDRLGRVVRETRPAYLTDTTAGLHVRTFHYDPDTGQLVRETATGRADRLYVYDAFGELWRTGDDLSPAVADHELTPASTDTLEQTDQNYEYVSADSSWYRVTTRSVARADGSETLSIASIVKDRLNLPEGMLSQTISIDQAGQITTRTVTVDRAAQLVRETVNYPGVSNPRVSVTRNGLLQSVQEPYQTQPTTYTYDGIGRVDTITDPARGVELDYDYDIDDRVETITTRSADSTLSLVESLTYHPQSFDTNGQVQVFPGAGQIATRTSAGRTVNYAYDLRGKVLRAWGDTYPVRYEYDTLGRLEKLHTYRDASGIDFGTDDWAAGSPDTTTWSYHPHTGQLIAKTDAASPGGAVRYTYRPSGALHTRIWARNITTTYDYTPTGALESIAYEEPGTPPELKTPGVGITYHRDGRINTLTDAAGQRTFTYLTDDDSYRRSGESYSAIGLLADLSIYNPVDKQGRPGSAVVKRQTTELHGYTYSYIPTTGLLDKVQSGVKVADYTYANDSSWVDYITFQPAGIAGSVRQTRTPDDLGRLYSIYTEGAAPQSLAGYTYSYDDRNRRETATLADGQGWLYDYDDYDQVTIAKKLKTDGINVLPGYDFSYDFDDIGNRTETTTNGHTATYTPNELNQYEQSIVPGYLDVRGRAGTNTTVTVNGTATTRTGMEFYQQREVDNDPDPVSTDLTVLATLASPAQSVSQVRPAYLPATPEEYDYDLDGNLTQDGRWDYTWDAENRLIRLETRSDVAILYPALKRRLEFAYDAQGRRISKIVKTPGASPGLWNIMEEIRFVYDGWNLLAELQPAAGTNYTTLRTYVWGSDLSGTTQGAGGVGGLLWAQAGGGAYVAGYDGNGNISAWVNIDTGYLTGQRDYAAFGEPVQVAGVAAQIPFGFSSKYQDAETGFNYYGFRYYNPSTGRWLGRDPLEEQGGLNLYGMVGNDPVNTWDYLGLTDSGHPVWNYGDVLTWDRESLPWQITRAALRRLSAGGLNHLFTMPANFDDSYYELEYRNESSIGMMVESYIKKNLKKGDFRSEYYTLPAYNKNFLADAKDGISAKAYWGSRLIAGARELIGDGNIRVRCGPSGKYEFTLGESFKWKWVDEFEFKSLSEMQTRSPSLSSQIFEGIVLRGLVHGVWGMDMPYTVTWYAGWFTKKPRQFVWR